MYADRGESLSDLVYVIQRISETMMSEDPFLLPRTAYALGALLTKRLV